MEDPHLRQLLASAGTPERSDHTMLVYHATTTCGARNILHDKVLKAREGERESFLSTGPGVVAVLDSAEVVLPVRVAFKDLREHRNWLDHPEPSLQRVDLVVQAGEYEPIAVGRAAYDGEGVEGGPAAAETLDFSPPDRRS